MVRMSTVLGQKRRLKRILSWFRFITIDAIADTGTKFTVNGCPKIHQLIDRLTKRKFTSLLALIDGFLYPVKPN